jgi:TonB-linked SusC/RagA family outer membrane protein
MIKIFKIALLAVFLFLTQTLRAQVRVITGRVLDEKRQTMPGVVITDIKDPKNAGVTDEKGNFRLTIKDDNSLFKFNTVGYVTQTVDFRGRNVLNVNMAPDVKGLEDVVVVGYGRQKRVTSVGAVSSLKAEEIRSVPTASLQNALVGRLPGLFSTQRSGQPGSDGADFYIRGVNSLVSGDNSPLVIVDDIEYTYAQVSQLNVNEIETVTILKDASTTAIYGVRGANGVLVITTRRGTIGKPRINFNAETGVNKVIRFPTYLDSYTTATLMNEAFINDSYGLSSPLTLPWTPSDLQKFKDGSDPYGHPNVNWTEQLLKRSSRQSRYNIDVSGGNTIVKYFTSLGYFTQDGLLKHFSPSNPEDDVDNNYYYNRFNFRSNLDITPTKTLKLRFDVNGRFETVNNPGGVQDGQGLFKELVTFRALPPFVMPVNNPDGSYGYASQTWANGFANPITRMANGGYNRNFNNNFNILVGANQKLNFITSGLTANVNVSYASNINEHRNINRDLNALPVFFYNSVSDSYTIKNANNYKLPIYTSNINNDAFNNRTIIQASLNYDRTFGDHNFNALALLNQNSYVNRGDVPVNFRGLTGRVKYEFKQRYLLEVSVGRNGNDLFLKKYGTFPSIAVGWNLAGEPLFHKALPFIDLFKVRGTYGMTGTDFGAPVIQTEIQYGLPGGTTFGSGANEGALVNPYITWAKEKQKNLGFDINMLNGKIALTADFFHRRRYDQLIDQGDVPNLIGQVLPKKNIGISENRGFEGVLTFKDKIGQLNFSISGNYSHYTTKVIYTSEAPDYPNLAFTGRQLGQVLGYHNVGFYQVNDFDATGAVKAGVPKPDWSTIQPGDLKYADLNGDGIITSADRTYLSKPNIPSATYGINLNLNYKGVSLSTLVQGAYGYAIQINAEGSDAFYGNVTPWHLERWTPATAATATYPRIGFNTNINNDSYRTVSDFWFANASYVRLKSVELGYKIPDRWLKKTSFINSLQLYATGYNLLTLREVGKFQVDPEILNSQGQAYPITANFALGLRIGL